MQRLTTDLMGQACRIFLSLAYPEGEGEGEGEGTGVIPSTKRPFLGLLPGLAMIDFIETDPAIRGCCQLTAKSGSGVGMLVRLGCCHYPHLKLKVQLFSSAGEEVWLFSVDTHDAFSATNLLPPAGHPDALGWMAIQTANRVLKEKIEAAWEAAGLADFQRSAAAAN